MPTGDPSFLQATAPFLHNKWWAGLRQEQPRSSGMMNKDLVAVSGLLLALTRSGRLSNRLLSPALRLLTQVPSSAATMPLASLRQQSTSLFTNHSHLQTLCLARQPICLQPVWPTGGAHGRLYQAGQQRSLHSVRLQSDRWQRMHVNEPWRMLRDAREDTLRRMTHLLNEYSLTKQPGTAWSRCMQLWQDAAKRLPAAAGEGHVQISILNALNLVGQQLPRLLGLALAEALRNRCASADSGFRYYLDVPASLAERRPQSWLSTVGRELREALVNVLRILHIMLLFAPVALSAPIAIYLNYKREDWMELLRKTLEAAGPAFIKWGQWAATRHDMFPPDFCSELEKLHCQAPAHAFRHTRKAIEEAFGMAMQDVFESVEVAPVASGSIGQVHRAVLNSRGAALTGFKEGTVVAVKVRHPGVSDAILRDFAVMVWIAHVATLVPALSELRLEDTLKQFAAPLREQVDLSREAHNLWRFNHNFRKTRFVHFPVPLYPLVSPDVLVESFEAGSSISRYIEQKGNPYNHRLAELGSGTMLQMMLVDNLIHSDLHPGNILVRLERPAGLLGWAYRAVQALRTVPELSRTAELLNLPDSHLAALQSAWLEPKIVLLDVGMATEMTDLDRHNMLNLFRCFAALNGRGVGEWVLAFSGDEQACPAPEAFTTAMQEHFDELRRLVELEQAGAEGAKSFKRGAEALAAVLETIRQYKVTMPGHICAVVVTTLVLEGWSNKLDPGHSVLAQVRDMFSTEHVPWRDRVGLAVDTVMGCEPEGTASLV